MKKGFIATVFFMFLFAGHISMASIVKSGLHLEIDEFSSSESFMSESYESTHPQYERPDMIPCDGRISSEFGMRKLSGEHGRMHEGIDIAAPVGTPVIAPASGTVVFAGRQSGYGQVVILSHGDDITTLYGHASKIFVKEGDYVERGQKISQVGNTGHSTGPHVHYEVRVHGTATDPMTYL